MIEDLENPTPKASGLRLAARRGRRWLWLIMPLVCFVALETTARRWQRVQPRAREDVWTAKEHTIRSDLPLSYLFIGSSRVAAAVDEKVFEESMTRQLGRPVQAINYGYGYTCMVQHYLNLRNLARSHPEQMRGCVLFVEAFGGMPQARNWNARWFDPGWSHLLLPLLRPEDLPRLWASEMTTEERLRLNEDARAISDVFTRHCALLRNRDRMSNECMAFGQRYFDKMMAKVLRRPKAPPPQLADLKTAGGIRNDQDGVQLAKKLALDWAKTMIANQSPVRLPEDSVEFDLIRLVQGLGGQVVFYEVPIHSVQAAVYETPVRREDRQFFRGQLADRGAYYLVPDFVARDEDIPDFWHLSRSRSLEFTKALAKAWFQASSPRLTAQRP